MGIVLRGPGVYVPSQILSNADLVELVDEKGSRVIDTNNEWIVSMTGIRERRISLDEDVRTLGIKGAEDLKQRLGGSLGGVDEVRFATNRHRDGEFPNYASSVTSALGIEEAVMHDGLAGCTGLVYSIRDAYNAIFVGDISSSLVGGVERLTDFTDFSDRSTCCLFGDGAGWYKLERVKGEEGIVANVLGGSPDREGHLTITKRPGKKLRFKNGKFIAFDEVDDYIVMNGREVFRFAKRNMTRAIEDVLKRSGKYSLSDVDAIIPHGANIRIIEYAEQELRKQGFRGVIYTNLDRFGNTSTASIPLAHREAKDRGIVKPGDLVVAVSFGAGLTYGATLFREAA